MSIRKATVLAVVMLVLWSMSSVSMAASGKEISGVVRISHGWGGVRLPAFEKLNAEFESMYPGVKIEATVVANTDQRHQQLLTAVAGGDPPDVGMLGRVALGQFAANNALIPIDEFLAADGLSIPDLYCEAAVDMVMWNGKIYGLPVSSGATQHFLYWNKKLFREAGLDPEKAPATWQDLESYALKLTKRDGNNNVQSIGIDPVNAGRPVAENHWRAFLANNNGYIVSKDGRKVLFNSPEGIEALEFMLRLIEAQVGSYSWIQQNIGLTVGDYNTSFYRGKVAMIINGSWFPNYMRNEVPDLEWGVAQVPYNSDNPHAKSVCVGVSGVVYALMRGAKNPTAAWEYMKYLGTGEAYKKFYFEELIVPTHNPRYNEMFDASNIPGWSVFAEAIATSRTMATTPVTPQIMEAMKRYQELAMLRKLSPKEAADKAAQEAQQALDTAKW